MKTSSSRTGKSFTASRTSGGVKPKNNIPSYTCSPVYNIKKKNSFGSNCMYSFLHETGSKCKDSGAKYARPGSNLNYPFVTFVSKLFPKQALVFTSLWYRSFENTMGK